METIVLKKLIDLLTDAIKSVSRGKRLNSEQKRCGRLISEAVQELLSIDPDLHTVKAKLTLAESISSVPSKELSRAQEMLAAATSRKVVRVQPIALRYYDTCGEAVITSLLRKQATKREAVVRKAARKRARMKVIGRPTGRKKVVKRKILAKRPHKKTITKGVAKRQAGKKKTKTKSRK